MVSWLHCLVLTFVPSFGKKTFSVCSKTGLNFAQQNNLARNFNKDIHYTRLVGIPCVYSSTFKSCQYSTESEDGVYWTVDKWTYIRHIFSRVGHHVLLRSERIVLFRSFKERNVLLHPFFECLATYDTQKNDAFFCVLFLRT